MNLRYILSKYWWFLALLIVAGIFLGKNKRAGTLNPAETNFSYTNTDRITSVIISDSQGSISLMYNGNEWILNGDGMADNVPINALLFALSNVRVASPILLSLQDSIRQELIINGRSVKVFSGKRPIKEFSMLETHAKERGVVGMLRKAKKPYRLELTGYDGNIYNIFSTNPSHWLSKRIAIPDLQNLSAVEVEIPSKPEMSYRIDKADGKTIKLFNLLQGKYYRQFDTLKVLNVLQNLHSLRYKEKVSGFTANEMKSVLSVPPDFVFIIYPTSGEPIIMKVIPIPIEGQIDDLGRPVTYDPNTLYINIGSKPDLYKISYIDCFPILKEISHFNPNF